jgi:hypothetical protein
MTCMLQGRRRQVVTCMGERGEVSGELGLAAGRGRAAAGAENSRPVTRQRTTQLSLNEVGGTRHERRRAVPPRSTNRSKALHDIDDDKCAPSVSVF